MSTSSSPHCTNCLKKLVNHNPQYRTCDQCRPAGRARKWIRWIPQQSVIRTNNETCIPENTAAVNPSPNYNAFYNSIERVTPLKKRGDPSHLLAEPSTTLPTTQPSFIPSVESPTVTTSPRTLKRKISEDTRPSTSLTAIQPLLPKARKRKFSENTRKSISTSVIRP